MGKRNDSMIINELNKGITYNNKLYAIKIFFGGYRHMTILNNTLCDKCKCFNRCDEQYGEGVPPCAGAVVESCHSLQHLQAEIALLISVFNRGNRTEFLDHFVRRVERLRQLSAVQ